MPIYLYRCPNGHEHDVLARHAERPTSEPCPTCAAASAPAPAAPAATMGCKPPVSDRPVVREIGHALDERWCECRACGQTTYDVAESEDPLPSCPGCGGETFKRVQIPRTASVQHYPYFEPSLNVWITSASHYRDLLKQQGLVEMTGEADYLARQKAKADAARLAEEAAADKYFHDLEHAPEYREYREMRAKGMFDHHLPADPGPFNPYR